MQYVTLSEGIDFRKIAAIMTEAGYQMNHATARNVLMHSLSKVLRAVSDGFSLNLTEDRIKQLLKNPAVHEALADILFEAHQKLLEEQQG